MANQCTKFEVSSLSCSRDILGGLKIYNGLCDVTMPLSGSVCRLWAETAMINRHTKFEVFMFTYYEEMKGNA